ncbi:MAG: response regulator transcription factor [Chitinophagaceae bacterium]|nr:response regulator transcription factor [Chitinophagaceae bacterium]
MYSTKTNFELSYKRLPSMKNGKITLALVDDHQIVIDGLMSLLKGHDKFRFAFATTDSSEVVQKLAETPVDILLTDVMMPKLPGNELAKKVKATISRGKDTGPFNERTRRPGE